MCVFFFKQKTAYEMLRSLVGSEMCIRDRPRARPGRLQRPDGTEYSRLSPAAALPDGAFALGAYYNTFTTQVLYEVL